MNTLNDIKKKMKLIRPAVVAVGNFDGVHLGHQAIFKTMDLIAKKNRLESIALVLYPHPKEFFTGSSPALLTTLGDRIKLIRDCGVNHVESLKFDLELSETKVDDLIKILMNDFRMKHLVLGPTTHLGKNREGTPAYLIEFGKKIKLDVTVVEEEQIKGCHVSSSSIRNYISRGEVRWVSDMLGRFYSTRGVVGTGMGKGRTIGFPTANITQIQTMVPVRGVYAGYALLGDKKYKAAINVGLRPTVTDDKIMVVECHLLDFDQKIVGQALEIQWVEKLRDEIKFESIDQLKVQILNDVRKTSSIL